MQTPATAGAGEAKPARFHARRFRERLPEILLEAGSVLTAVLLAFAVEEWRDARAKQQLADRARQGIVAELQANREELRGAYDANTRQLQSLQRTVNQFTVDPALKHAQVELGFVAAQLSDAAWDTTQATQAAQLLPFDWVVRMARVYETQALYKTAQLDMLQRTRTAVSEFATSRPPSEIVAPLRSQLETFQSLGQQLLKRYDDVLESSRGRDK